MRRVPVLEELGSAMGSDDRRVKADIECLREMIESRSAEQGVWRGEVERGEIS